MVLWWGWGSSDECFDVHNFYKLDLRVLNLLAPKPHKIYFRKAVNFIIIYK